MKLKNALIMLSLLLSVGCYDSIVYNGKAKLSPRDNYPSGVINKKIGIKSEGYIEMTFDIEKIISDVNSYEDYSEIYLTANARSFYNNDFNACRLRINIDPYGSGLYNLAYSLINQELGDNLHYENLIYLNTKNIKLGCEYYRDGDDLIMSIYLNQELKASKIFYGDDGMFNEDGNVGFGGYSELNLVNISNFKFFDEIPFPRQTPIYEDL